MKYAMYSILAGLILLWPSNVLAETLETVFQSGEYSIEVNEGGLHKISMEGFTTQGEPGNPLLPTKTFKILLPPDVDTSTISLRVVNMNEVKLEGEFDIAPQPPFVARFDGQTVASWGDAANIVDGRNMDVYSDNKRFPFARMEKRGTATMRRWHYVEVKVSPFSYNPVSGELYVASSIHAAVDFERNEFAVQSSDRLQGGVLDSMAPEMFHNYGDVKNEYERTTFQMQSFSAQAASYDYVIVTTNAIRAGSSQLDTFKTFKESLGYSVLIIDEDDYGAVTGQSPNGREEKIRKWLQNNYASYGIQYVLMIGNPTPGGTATDSVPMKMCWPRRSDSSYKESPTDMFYAELTGNWDLDGDGYYGEHSGDTGVGGVEMGVEVLVGRIPVYDSAYGTLDAILQKIMNYQGETNTAWRSNVLLPMTYSDLNTDGAELSEDMENDYLDSAGYSTYKMYHQGACNANFNSNYISDQELTTNSVVAHWKNNPYGIMAWWGHGSKYGTYLGGDNIDCGTLFYYNQAPQLDDSKPAFTFQNSCNNGWPEDKYNLQYALLKSGGIATVGASRVSWYYPGQTDFTGSGSNAGMTYEYTKRIAQELTAGEALFQTKQTCYTNDRHILMNMYDFNLYGDPSVSIADNSAGGVIGVTPGSDAEFEGNVGGSFTPANTTYTLKNNTTGAINWTASKTQNWLNISPTSGSLNAGQSVNITVSLAAAADALDAGLYTDTITFTDTSNSVSSTRSVDLGVGIPSPNGVQTVNSPMFRWKEHSGALEYQVQVYKGSYKLIDQWLKVADLTIANGVCSYDFGNLYGYYGDMTWYVRAWDGNYYPWSEAVSFTTPTPQPPPAPTTVAPEGTIGDYTPTLQWNAATDATWYKINMIDGSGSTLLDTWFTKAEVCVGNDCSYTMSSMDGGTYTWKILSWNDYGENWSTTKTFTLPSTEPSKVTLETPSGNIIDTTPTFRWTKCNNSQWYYFWLTKPNGSSTKLWFENGDLTCNATHCWVDSPETLAQGGTHTWYVQTYSNSKGYGPWSDATTFTLPATEPGKVALEAPSGNIADTTPTLVWEKDNNADWYYISVAGASGNVMKQWFQNSDVTCNATSCYVDSPVAFSGDNGPFTWYVQTYHSTKGYGPWSDGMTFNLPSTKPSKVSLQSPSGNIADTTPTFQWAECPNSNWYYLWVDGPGGNIIKKWLKDTDVTCNAGICEYDSPVTLTQGGEHTWFIQTYNDSNGYGPWSDAVTFTLPSTAPVKVTLEGPSGSTADTTPTLQWSEDPNATWYYLWINGPGGTIKHWFEKADVTCNAGSCQADTPYDLSSGVQTWWIQTYNESHGYGPWSDSADFTVN